MGEVETKFSVMVSLFEWIQKSKQAAKKRSKLRKFLDTFCNPSDYFGPVRLLLPSLDRERGSYGLKESVLATSLVDALGMSRDSPDALRLFNWRKGGAATGSNAGHFALVASEVLQRRQGIASGGLTIKELNELLDRLASSESRNEKISVISSLIKKTNAQEMKWIIMIILKDLKLGISEKTIFHEFHPDAEDLFNVTCDLKLVCEKLRDRSKRHKRQDIEVGKAVRPQLANRISDAHAAWKKLHGKEVVVECKFDGDRIQVHKNGAEVHYFSRNFLDHTEYGPAMSGIIMKNVLAERCILDGEMLVWDNSLNRFTEFGSNQEIAKVAKDGLDSHRQLCYVAFDVLYVGDTSVIHQSLKERQELLQKVVQPLKGRLEILVPKGGLNSHRLPGEPCWSLIAHDVDDVERFYKETIENRDEGIVIKDLGSKWEPGDRSGKWMKLKPDYVRAGSDLDVLIIGGYYGSGRRGGEIAQFLVALAERPAPNTYPKRFISFCRVGTGLSDDDLDAVVTKLKPYFRRYEYPKKAPPTFYQVTNHSKERPDVWIESPEKSIMLSITSDIRTIRSEVFAAPYGLRFPRIDKVRYDKPWYECLDVQTFVDLVHSSNGTTQKGKEQMQEGNKPNRPKSAKRGERRNAYLVPSHLIHTDVSNIEGQSMIFSNIMFYFVNVPPTHSLESLHKMVAENGGTFAMNLNSSVTHRIAAESKGIKYQAAKLQGDVIHCSWVFDCVSQKKLLPLQPKYFLFISNTTKEKLEEEIDEFSDSYYWNLDLVDIRQLLNDMKPPEDVNVTDDIRKKYCPDEIWCRFNGCSVYFLISLPSTRELELDALLEIIARRLKLEIVMGGGKVTHDLTESTHVVFLPAPDSDIDFDVIRGSFTASEKRLLRKKRLHLIQSQWLEDSLERGMKLPVDTYSLKPAELELILDDSGQDPEGNESPPRLDVERDRKASSLIAGVTKDTGDGSISGTSSAPLARNRGAKSKKGPARKRGASQAPRTRARIAKRPAKIYDEKSEESSSNDENNTGVTQKREVEHDIDRGITSKHKGEVVQPKDSESVHGDQDLCEARDVDSNIKLETFEELLPGPSNIHSDERQLGKEGELPDKLEVMVDPVHAMLMDMIPSLGMKRTETVEAPKPRDEKRPAADPEPKPQPSKKKKVSYKDLAGELLKDW